MSTKWKFEAVPRIFRDMSEFATRPEDKFETQPSLGLLTRTYPCDDQMSPDLRDWTRFRRYVSYLNEQAPSNVSYKVLYLTRHGMGFHNQKHAEVGTEEWNNNWSLRDGDGVNTWFDSYLTEEGEQQAHTLSEFWSSLVDVHNAPLPQSLYASPLVRCLQTCTYVFEPLMTSHDAKFSPLIKERLRERWTLHTCDKRRTRSWIEANWKSQGFRLEEGFEEEDRLGNTKTFETDPEHMARKQKALEEIFDTDASEFISLAIHSIAIRTIFMLCGAQPFRVREGSSVGILIKGEKL